MMQVQMTARTLGVLNLGKITLGGSSSSQNSPITKLLDLPSQL